MTDKLLGDITSNVLKKAGVDKLAKAYARVTGKPCNCAGRRRVLNNIHRMIVGQPIEREGRTIRQVARPPVAPVDEQPARK